MASCPIISRGVVGEKVETVTEFIFLGSKITVDSDQSHKIKRCKLLGRKAMTNLDSLLKSRDITLLTKVHLLKAIYGFSSSHVGYDHKEGSAPLNCGAGEDSLRVPWTLSQGDQTSQS